MLTDHFALVVWCGMLRLMREQEIDFAQQTDEQLLEVLLRSTVRLKTHRPCSECSLIFRAAPFATSSLHQPKRGDPPL